MSEFSSHDTFTGTIRQSQRWEAMGKQKKFKRDKLYPKSLGYILFLRRLQEADPSVAESIAKQLMESYLEDVDAHLAKVWEPYDKWSQERMRNEAHRI